MNGDTNIQCLKGIGEKTYNGFKKLGVETVGQPDHYVSQILSDL